MDAIRGFTEDEMKRIDRDDDTKLITVFCRRCGRIEKVTEDRYVNIKEQLCLKCRPMSDDEFGISTFMMDEEFER